MPFQEDILVVLTDWGGHTDGPQELGADILVALATAYASYV